jgi:hypothetical protein
VFITCTKDEITALKQLVFNKYKCRDLSPISYYLGIRIRRDCRARAIKLSIELYIKKLIKDYNRGYVTRYNLINVKALKLKLCRADDACNDRSL